MPDRQLTDEQKSILRQCLWDLTLTPEEFLAEFDYSLLDTEIKWIRPISSEEIRTFMTEISMAIVRGTVK